MASSRAAPSLLSGAAGAGAGATGDVNDLLGAGGGSVGEGSKGGSGTAAGGGV